MSGWKVVEKANPLAVHCLTWSEARGKEWIEKYGDSGMFCDKSLRRDSFVVVPADQHGRAAQ